MSRNNNRIGTTIPGIIARHLFTPFNAFNFAIGFYLAAVGAYENPLYLVIILCNILIGIVQDVRSKRMVDKLSLLTAPSVTMLRDGVILLISRCIPAPFQSFHWRDGYARANDASLTIMLAYCSICIAALDLDYT